MITVTVRFNEKNLLGGTSQNEIDAINIDATVNKLFSEITDDVRATFSDAELHLNLEYGQYANSSINIDSSMNIDVDDDNIVLIFDIRDFINEIVERRLLPTPILTSAKFDL